MFYSLFCVFRTREKIPWPRVEEQVEITDEKNFNAYLTYASQNSLTTYEIEDTSIEDSLYMFGQRIRKSNQSILKAIGSCG